MKLTTALVLVLALGAEAAGCSKEKPAAPAADHSQHGGMAMPEAGPGPVTIAAEVRARIEVDGSVHTLH